MWFALLTFYFKGVKLNYANRISLIGFRVKKNSLLHYKISGSY